MSVKHKAKPESRNWYTAKRGGRWRDACADCGRTVELCYRGDTGFWRHAK